MKGKEKKGKGKGKEKETNSAAEGLGSCPSSEMLLDNICNVFGCVDVPIEQLVSVRFIFLDAVAANPLPPLVSLLLDLRSQGPTTGIGLEYFSMATMREHRSLELVNKNKSTTFG